MLDFLLEWVYMYHTHLKTVLRLHEIFYTDLYLVLYPDTRYLSLLMRNFHIVQSNLRVTKGKKHGFVIVLHSWAEDR